MTGTLAQLLSLISFGNEYIVKGKLETDFYPANSVFQYCKQVRFITSKEDFFRRKKSANAGDDPLKWFHYLKQNDCRELKGFYQHSKEQENFKDYQLASFIGGGGQWMIEAIYKDYSDFWYPQWDVGNRDDPDKKIWKVLYEAVAIKQSTRNIQFLLYPTKEAFEKKLSEIEIFARENDLDFWAKWFDKAVEALNSETPHLDFFHPDMILLKNYSLPAQQLIFAAGKAWVFGGMGSWNDLGFNEKEKQRKYAKITEELYDAVIVAFLAGINT